MSKCSSISSEQTNFEQMGQSNPAETNRTDKIHSQLLSYLCDLFLLHHVGQLKDNKTYLFISFQ